jgi:hypothetical protein
LVIREGARLGGETGRGELLTLGRHSIAPEDSVITEESERLFPGNSLGIFILNRLVLETLPYPHRDDDGWA